LSLCFRSLPFRAFIDRELVVLPEFIPYLVLRICLHQEVRGWKALNARIEEYDDSPIELWDRTQGMARRVTWQKEITEVIYGSRSERTRLEMVLKEIDDAIELAKSKQNNASVDEARQELELVRTILERAQEELVVDEQSYFERMEKPMTRKASDPPQLERREPGEKEAEEKQAPGELEEKSEAHSEEQEQVTRQEERRKIAQIPDRELEKWGMLHIFY
uniref:MT domain-containing protein n=1 Tax=Nippostrongylus brasiliensis TaxID=27835 RepID=A0A0N4XG37_NIPBR